MKDTLLRAAAVLLLTPALAQAQSNVTVYGRVDMGVSKENDGTTTLAGGINNGSDLQLRQGSGSRLGFRGVEDLGGGYKALFQFEHRFNPDTGDSTSTTFWNGLSIVGLSGPFGRVKLGRDYTPAFDVGLRADPWGFTTIAQMGSAATPGSAVRTPNMVSYETASFGGFTAKAAFSAKEVSTAGARDGVSADVIYAAGPLWLGVAYERPVRTAGTAPDVDFWIATGAYKFGPAQVIGTFTSGRSDPPTAATARSDRRHLGLAFTYDVAAGQLRAMASRFENQTSAAGAVAANKAITTKFGLGYFHFLSKRTSLYFDVAQAKTTNTTVADRTARRGFDLGIRHNF